MFEIFNETFMIHALIIGISLSITAALISPFLVLNQQAMIADGMSHIAFTSIILGFLLSEQPLYLGVPLVVLSSIAITFLSDHTSINNDAAISVVSSVSLALGLIVVTLGSGFNRSIESLLIGNILTVTKTEITLSLVLLLVTLLFVILNYRSLLSMTYDRDYANFLGVKTTFLKYTLSALTALFVIVGVRTVGTLLISAFIVFPVLIASQISNGFKRTFINGIFISILSMFLGIVCSFYLNFPTGSTVVMIFFVFLVLGFLFQRRKKHGL